ncbi:MAG: hypothetical protein AAGA48_18775 [Myxococcota bacterium]
MSRRPDVHDYGQEVKHLAHSPLLQAPPLEIQLVYGVSAPLVGFAASSLEVVAGWAGETVQVKAVLAQPGRPHRDDRVFVGIQVPAGPCRRRDLRAHYDQHVADLIEGCPAGPRWSKPALHLVGQAPEGCEAVSLIRGIEADSKQAWPTIAGRSTRALATLVGVALARHSGVADPLGLALGGGDGARVAADALEDAGHRPLADGVRWLIGHAGGEGVPHLRLHAKRGGAGPFVDRAVFGQRYDTATQPVRQLGHPLDLPADFDEAMTGLLGAVSSQGSGYVLAFQDPGQAARQADLRDALLGPWLLLERKLEADHPRQTLVDVHDRALSADLWRHPGPMSREDVSRFEQALNVRIPDGLAWFLTEISRGIPKGPWLSYAGWAFDGHAGWPIDGPSQDEIAIRALLHPDGPPRVERAADTALPLAPPAALTSLLRMGPGCFLVTAGDRAEQRIRFVGDEVHRDDTPLFAWLAERYWTWLGRAPV